MCVGLLLVLAVAIGYRLGGVKPSTTRSSGGTSGTKPRRRRLLRAVRERDTGAIRVLDRRTGRDRLWGVVPNAKNIHVWNPAISPDGGTMLFDREVSLRANLWLVDDFR
jgi:hypothetical protein